MEKKLLIVIFMIATHLTVSGQYVRAKIHDRFNSFVEQIQTKYYIDLGTHSAIFPANVRNAFDSCRVHVAMFNEQELEELLFLKKQYDLIASADESAPSETKVLEEKDGFYSYAEGEKLDEDKPILKYFYKNKNHFLSLDKGNFGLRLDPILDLSYASATNDDQILFRNTRGVELSAIIDNKLMVYTSIFENQARFPTYVEDYITRFAAIPGNGLYKPYNSSVIDRLQGRDFLNAQAYVGIPLSKNIQIELGHGKHFIGNGVRSLLLSDFSNNYLFLKFNAQFWKFHYQTIYAELNGSSPNENIYSPNSALLPKKYTANHYLSFRPNTRFEIGLFETVIFGRRDHLELQYLNPIILYRTVEQFLNSPDNVIVGFNASYSPVKKLKLYAQFVLDEFSLPNLRARNGWWANKYGIQLGAKAIDLVKGLDLGIEYNAARPYTYSHYQPIDTTVGNKTITSYSHYNQALAHPLGANFKEVILTADYQFNQKLSAHFASFFWTQGLDPANQNFGSDILINYNSRTQDFGNEIGQGIKTQIRNVRGNLSYEFFPNYVLDLNVLYRKASSQSSNFLIGTGIRVNIAQQNFDF
ncbi:MAG: hypothetical protein IPN72_01050 [Saprospiraceae bacterium]|nr:hypothetical protein [Saprospiraceae bacterium]